MLIAEVQLHLQAGVGGEGATRQLTGLVLDEPQHPAVVGSKLAAGWLIVCKCAANLEL